jgi:hypothetical protein
MELRELSFYRRGRDVDLDDFRRDAEAANPRKHNWHPWFAWCPVPVGSGYIWLRTIERRYHTKFFAEGWEYRKFGSDKSGYKTTWSWF